jgi:hypothetical protein
MLISWWLTLLPWRWRLWAVDFHRTTQRYIAEDRTLRSHRCKNLNHADFSMAYSSILKMETMILRNVRWILPNFTASYSRRSYSSVLTNLITHS